MKPLFKTYEAEYKVFVDDAGNPTGEVQFYASVFNNVDLVGDRVMPGAFEDSLKSWRASGDPIPVVFSHNWGDPFAIIGYADPFNCVEDSKGLLVKAHLDIDTNPTALQAFKLMQRRIVKEASFSYDVESEKRAKDGANNLFKLNILEVGPCLKGANPLTDTVSAKSRDIKSILQGSVEERQAALGYAAAAKFGGGENGTWVYVEGTYSDRIIVGVFKDEDPATYFAVPYTITPEGDVTLGTEVEVELETTIQAADGSTVATAANGPAGTITTLPKSEEADTVETKVEAPADAEVKAAEPDGEKAGARNSRADQAALQAAHDALVTSGAVCSVPDEAPAAETKDEVSVEVDVHAAVEEGGPDHDEDDVKSIDYAQLAKDFAEFGDVDGELAALAKAAERRAKPESDKDEEAADGTEAKAYEAADEDKDDDTDESKADEADGAKAVEDGASDGSVVKPDELGIECPQCQGTGKVPDGDGTKDCPKCKGTGRIPKNPDGGSDNAVSGKSDKESDAVSSDVDAEGKAEDHASDKAEDPAEAKARMEADIADLEQFLAN